MDTEQLANNWQVPEELHSRILLLFQQPPIQKSLNIMSSNSITIEPQMLSGSYHCIVCISTTHDAIRHEYILRIPRKLNKLGDMHFPPEKRLLKEVGLLIWVERNVFLGDGVKTPQVLAYDSAFGDDNMLGMPWVLMEKIEGVSLDYIWEEEVENWQREKFVEQYVKILRRIEEVELPPSIRGHIGGISPRNVPTKWTGEHPEEVENIDLQCDGWDYWLGDGNGEFGDLEGPLREPMKPTSIDYEQGERSKSFFQKLIQGIQKWIPTVDSKKRSKDNIDPKHHPLFRELKVRIAEWIETSARLPEAVQDECQTFLYSILDEILDQMGSLPNFTTFLSPIRKSVLSHGDLFPRNILVDPSTCRITGIIDWDFSVAIPLPLTRELPSWIYTFEHTEGMDWEQPGTENEKEMHQYFFDKTLWGRDVYMEFYGHAYWVGWLWEIVVRWPLNRKKGKKMAEFVKECQRYLHDSTEQQSEIDSESCSPESCAPESRSQLALFKTMWVDIVNLRLVASGKGGSLA